MIRKLTYLLVTLLAMGSTAFAQERCGFDALHAKGMVNNPAYLKSVNQFNTSWANYNQSPNLPQGLVTTNSQGIMYEIPVVIHVIHTGGAVGSAYNPSDAQLLNMIDYLNATYATTWGAYPDSLSGGTRFPIRFVLARRTPGCAATNGIIRVNGSGLAGYTAGGINLDQTLGADDEDVKALSIWSNHDYYNIWVVNKIDGEDGISPASSYVAGYAYFPGAGAARDGTVMLASKAAAGQKTLPHEMGHAFGLYHTFQGGTTTVCPPNTNCNTDGDMICDTQPQRQSNFNCPTDPNPCTGTSYNNVQRNIMDYSSCPDRFTPGQRTRFFSMLLSERPSLLSSLGLLPPTTPGVTAAACTPTTTTPGNTFNAGPSKVILNDMTAETEGGYTRDGNRVYFDNACIQRANVTIGQSYPLSVTTGPNPERVRVYIDYNNDGIFGTTAPELVYTHDGTRSNEVHATNITIPTTGVVTCVPLRMRVVSDRVAAATAPTACGPLVTGQAEDYSVQVQGPSNTGTISIALIGGTNPSCINDPLTFRATPAGSATAPTFKWYINGVAVTNATATTFASATIANGAIITARIFYTGPCGADSSISNAITIIRNVAIPPSVSIALTNGANPGCAGQSLTFTATPVNGGAGPTYQWQMSTNGGTTWTTIASAGGATVTTAIVPCNASVRAIMTSSLSCASPATATSAAIVYTCTSTTTATTSITQTGGTNPTCKGQSVSFTANVTNPGTNPTYSWLLNGNPTGNNTLVFTTTTLNNRDTVQFRMVSNNPCVSEVTVVSNKIGVTVIDLDTPSVYLAITAGSNPGCGDSLLEFTATASSSFGLNGYTWYLNNVPVGTGTVFGGITFNTGDRLHVNVVAGPGCHVRDTAYSDTITITRYPTPPAPVISFIGNQVVSNVSQVQWYGPFGLIPGATGPSHRPEGPGNYYARAMNNGCPSLPSNVLQVSLLTIGNYNLSEVKIYPNPTNGMINFDWGGKMTTAKISLYTPTGQVVLQDFMQNASRKTLDISRFAAGIYFVVLQDEQGNTGTVKVTLTK